MLSELVPPVTAEVLPTQKLVIATSTYKMRIPELFEKIATSRGSLKVILFLHSLGFWTSACTKSASLD